MLTFIINSRQNAKRRQWSIDTDEETLKFTYTTKLLLMNRRE